MSTRTTSSVHAYYMMRQIHGEGFEGHFKISSTRRHLTPNTAQAKRNLCSGITRMYARYYQLHLIIETGKGQRTVNPLKLLRALFSICLPRDAPTQGSQCACFS